jgi:mono/diheme cytochrome c family protein
MINLARISPLKIASVVIALLLFAAMSCTHRGDQDPRGKAADDAPVQINDAVENTEEAASDWEEDKPASDTVLDGEQIFKDYCTECHSIDGVDVEEEDVKSLKGVALKYDAEYLTNLLDSHYTSEKLSDEQIDAVVEFLMTLEA